MNIVAYATLLLNSCIVHILGRFLGKTTWEKFETRSLSFRDSFRFRKSKCSGYWNKNDFTLKWSSFKRGRLYHSKNLPLKQRNNFKVDIGYRVLCVAHSASSGVLCNQLSRNFVRSTENLQSPPPMDQEMTTSDAFNSTDCTIDNRFWNQSTTQGICVILGCIQEIILNL